MTNAEEQFDSVDETTDDNTDDYGSEMDQEESSEEAEGEDRGDSEEDRESERTRRRDSQVERLKREKAELKEKLARLEGEKGGTTNADLVERTYLAANGYKDRDVQAEVLRLARKFDLSVDAALEDEDIKRRADTLLKEKQAKASVAPSTGGARQTTRDVSYWAKRLTEKGESAPTAEMRAKVLRHLAGKE